MSLPIVLVPHPHVRVDAKTLGGSPYVAGSRVLVRRLFAFYKNGTRIETILRRYPQLEPAKIFDALAFALDNPEVIEADLEREREMLERSGARAPRGGQSSDQIELPFGTPIPAGARPKNKSRPRGGS
jgi:uncharacterized protein (DUF433 family)